MMNDGFLDTLKTKSSIIIKSNPTLSKELAASIKEANSSDSFTATLMQYGKKFESKDTWINPMNFH